MLIKKPLEPILNQKYLRKDETSDILDTFDAPMINVSAVNPVGQSGDKITLIGKMFDDEIEGRNIDFYNGSTYLGTGKTNKYGVGIFDYTCSGAGKKEITGKWGSLESEPFSLYDCIVWDTCTLADSTKTTFTVLGNANFTRTNDYGALTERTSGTDGQMYVQNLPSSCIIDFEYLFVDGSVGGTGINLFSSDSYLTYVSLGNMGYTDSAVNTWFKLRATIGNGSVTLTDLDNPTKTYTKTYSSTFNQLGFNTSNTITEVRLKNIKVYPV